MPGPISQSYEGPSDDKPVAPEWAIQTPATAAVDSPGPLSYEEAKHFHDGFLAGATAYAAAVGHSTLKSDNEQLRSVFDAQGWKTIEAFERTPPMPTQLEQAVARWLRVNEKRPEQVFHGTFPLGMVQRWIERAEAAEADAERYKLQVATLEKVSAASDAAWKEQLDIAMNKGKKE